jgi:predicted transcriptional regulator of viral defense system
MSRLATRQHGVVSRPQLLAIGLSADVIDRLIARHSLQQIHRGVYAVGHRPRTRQATWMAAVLAAGSGAVLSHRSAAALWAIRGSSTSRLEVITPRLCRRGGIRARHIVLSPDEVTTEAGIPVTTPARTLFDLAAVVSAEQLEHAFNEAEIRRLTSPTSLDALVARYRGRRGTAVLTHILGKHDHSPIPTSILERRFLALLDTHDIPRPTINRRTEHGELDATWHEQRLIVECDGFAVHGTRKAFEDDRAKDRALQVAGWRVIRVTSRQLTTDGHTIVRQVRALLDAATPSPRPARRAPPQSRATRSAAP